MKLKIATKVSVLTGVLAGLASSIIGFVLIYGANEIIFNQELNQLKYETKNHAASIVKHINTLRDDTLYLSGIPPIQGIPRTRFNDGIDPLDNSTESLWMSRLETIFSELIRAKPNYRQIRLIGIEDGGREIVRVERFGKLIKSVNEQMLQRKGERDYFKKALSAQPGEVYISDVTLNYENGELTKPYLPVIRSVTPVYFKGDLFGVVVINEDVRELFNSLVFETPRAINPYVTNEEGYFLLHADKSQTFGFDLGHESKITDIFPSFNLTHTKDVRDNELTVFEDIGNSLNVIHFVKAQFDPLNPERFLGIALSTSNVNLLAESDRLKVYSYIVVAFLIIISFALSFGLATRLLQPLQKIAKASEDLAGGKVMDELPVNDKGEIGDLARSFSCMKTQLEEKESALLQSQQKAHQASKKAALGEMASGMAHEINSPILEVSMIAERVKRRLSNYDEKEVAEAMDQIVKSVEHVSGVIESLRKLSRDPDSNTFEKVNIKELVNDVISLCRQRFELNGIVLDVVYDEVSEKIELECQRLQISQVLINLINNAYDGVNHVENPLVRLQVSSSNEELTIFVFDNGKKISEYIQHNMFNPMFTTKATGEGTGLGLSISEGIAKMHHGKLFYDGSKQNNCFVLRLPIYKDFKG